MKLNHVMIDLETLGTKMDCKIASIGAVIFDPRYGIVSDETFYACLDHAKQTERVTYQDCIDEFWAKQPAKVREQLNGTELLDDVLDDLAFFLPKDCKVWGNGPTFDISKLESAYDYYEQEVPWKFWNIRCCRTILDMYESKRGGFNKKVGGDAHNALSDAIHQAKYVTMMWSKLLGKKGVK